MIQMTQEDFNTYSLQMAFWGAYLGFFITLAGWAAFKIFTRKNNSEE